MLQFIKFIQMTWIYQQCTDLVGHCIRQYVFFGLSIIIALLALYSFIKTLRSEHRFSFEVLPLAINSITSVIMIGIYFQTEDNTRLVLLVIQFYSYFILCYGFMSMALKQTLRFASLLNYVKTIFIAITSICVVAIAILIILISLEILTCNENQGIGAIIMMVLELPLIFFTYYFSHKCKELLQKQSTVHLNGSYNNPSIATKHLILQEDQYLKLKKLQLNLVRLALIITFLLHLVQILCYYVGDSGRICNEGSLVITNEFQIFIICVENISELFPHFIIPFIFWYIPNKIAVRSKTLHISNRIGATRYEQGHHKVNETPKLKMGDHQESQFYKDMHSEENIRSKLLPKTKTQRTSTL